MDRIRQDRPGALVPGSGGGPVPTPPTVAECGGDALYTVPPYNAPDLFRHVDGPAGGRLVHTAIGRRRRVTAGPDRR
ncbi:hypothetical protein AVW11_14530 [Streptomyces amritsarensis]|uniref:Uncharacterized protein n=1 Tax=Streptomyces amritsarensis TaxID=681158 RepID=A0ABX3G7C0_9ACTN|nr:hypothetical protein AVW11_14530 [Streptomyces amritsarensis]